LIIQLQEELVFESTKEQMKRVMDTGELTFPYKHSLRYLDKGDTLILKCEGEEKCFLVEEYKRDEHYNNIHDPKEIPKITVTVRLKEKEI
jgi:hypothetical protein